MARSTVARLRVLTLNIQHDAGDPRRLPLLNRELRRLRPDLAALQEVREEQLPVLLAGTGLTHTTHQSSLLDPAAAERFGGSVAATRWPHRVLDAVERSREDTHWWTLAVAVDLPVLGELLFLTPTTPWEPAAERAREHQARDVTTLIARHRTGLPVIVAGDLNADPTAPSVRRLTERLTDAWAAAGEGPGHTWTVDNPLAAAEIARLLGDPDHRRRIDYVLAGPNAGIAGVALVGHRPVEGVWLSDHYGVLAEVALP